MGSDRQPDPTRTGPPAISVTELSFDYHGKTALRGVSFNIHTGARVGIVGRNGAGKSTLLLHINGLLMGSGTVSIHGIPVEKKTLSQIRSQVGFVFSDAEDQLFMPTLAEDVAFGPLNLGLSAEQALERANQALAVMRLTELCDRSPHHLSDGERRRAAIATVLSMNPSIWVLDEPAANLDCQGRRELIGLLKDLAGTVVFASHDLDLVAQVCDRCLVMDAGKLVAVGGTEHILADSRLMERHGLEVPWRLRAPAAMFSKEKVL